MEGKVIEVNGKPVAMYNDGEATHTYSAVCTHLCCTVEWNANEKTFDCPCHGSRFNIKGEVIKGPAKRPLEPLQ